MLLFGNAQIDFSQAAYFFQHTFSALCEKDLQRIRLVDGRRTTVGRVRWFIISYHGVGDEDHSMGSDRICIREASKRLTSSDISPYCIHDMKNTKVEGFDASTKKRHA